MNYCNEDFTILSLIPIEIMNKSIKIKLIKIALNYYNKECLENEYNLKISEKKLNIQIKTLYSIETVQNKSYIINFYS